MRFFCIALVALALTSSVLGDLYMHAPRGSNNRANSNNEEANGNRCFDSQNNNQGGYGIHIMEPIIYAGSILTVEWTAQHSCGDPNNHCEIVFQWLCETEVGGPGATLPFQDTNQGVNRNDAQVRNRIDISEGTESAILEDPDNVNNGFFHPCRYETLDSYLTCQDRERNKGLFVPEGNNVRNDRGATATRQNPNGNNRRGLECPEERDYYPYWHPTPYRDLFVLTTNTSRCPLYEEESFNVKAKGRCNSDRSINNPTDCTDWVEDPPFDIDPPFCGPAPRSRDNHLGNAAGDGQTANFNLTLPRTGLPLPNRCLFRMRYNISTGDYPWDADYRNNGDYEHLFGGDGDTVAFDIDPSLTLTLQINDDQLGRTFQDRSGIHRIEPVPLEFADCVKVHNVHNRGRRGNIVQSYPAVEYDFVPTHVVAGLFDCLHIWWSGTQAQNGDGTGQDTTDYFNLAQTEEEGQNVPLPLTEWTFPKKQQDIDNQNLQEWRLKAASGCGGSGELDDASVYCDLGLVKLTEKGELNFVSTRNNNFSNRSNKLRITVGNAESLPFTTWLAIGGAGFVIAAAGALILGAVHVRKNPHGKLAGMLPGRSGFAATGLAVDVDPTATTFSNDFKDTYSQASAGTRGAGSKNSKRSQRA